jgi:hypothetical protein
MGFTEYLFDADAIRELAAERAANLRANRGLSDLLGFGLSVVRQRLAKDSRRYRDYGPYWWALKDVLRRNGLDLGAQSDPLMMQTYRGASDVETLVMADEFRTMYLGTFILGTNQFYLDADESDPWTVFDSDMETPT